MGFLSSFRKSKRIANKISKVIAPSKPSSSRNKPSPSLYQMNVDNSLKQIKECVNLVNTTIKPDVFFERLNFLLDLCLELHDNKYLRINGKKIPDFLQSVQDQMVPTVNDFIDRAFEKESAKIEALKTDKAKAGRKERFINGMFDAFKNANTFWIGRTYSGPNVLQPPHYTGPLYTDENLEYLKQMAEKMNPV